MSENEKKEMLEKEEAVFEQELSEKEMEQVSGGNEEVCSEQPLEALRRCEVANILRGDAMEALRECERGNTLRGEGLEALRKCERGNTLRGNV